MKTLLPLQKRETCHPDSETDTGRCLGELPSRDIGSKCAARDVHERRTAAGGNRGTTDAQGIQSHREMLHHLAELLSSSLKETYDMTHRVTSVERSAFDARTANCPVVAFATWACLSLIDYVSEEVEWHHP